jgi:hypothetical protein
MRFLLICLGGAGVNIVLNTALCLAACGLGLYLGRVFPR